MPFQPAKLNYPKVTQPALDPTHVALVKTAMVAQLTMWDALNKLEHQSGVPMEASDLSNYVVDCLTANDIDDALAEECLQYVIDEQDDGEDDDGCL